MSSITDTQVINATGGQVELAYLPLGTNNFGISAGTNAYIGGTATAVCDGSPVIVECLIPRVDVAATGDMYVDIEVDGTSYGRIGNIYNPGTQVDAQTLYMSQRLTPSAGVHTFRVRAYATGATTTIVTGDGATYATLAQAYLRVSKIVQATQWPAVTTGTIICTSTTRPSSPFVGQQIYEADTSRNRYWNGTSWVGRGWEKIGDFTNNSTSLTYTSIPQTYQHLQVRWVAQSNRAGQANTGGRYRWNGLTSANYQITYNYVVGVSSSTGGATGQSFGYVGQIPAGSRANDNYVAECIIDFPYYTATNRIRTAHSRLSGYDGTNYLLGNCGATNDSSIAAITSITLLDDVAGTLGPRSSAELWGLWA